MEYLRQYLFLSCLLLSTTTIAMNPPEPNKSTSTKLSTATHYPVPPEITYADYTTVLFSKNGTVDRWGNSSDNLSAWLQSPVNKAKLTDRDGKDLDDLCLFKGTLIPIIEDKKLRCDYYLPIVDSDPTTECPSLSLSCVATKAEIKAVRKVQPEPVLEYTRRLLRWQEILKKRQAVSNSIVARMISDYTFIPEITQHEGSFYVDFTREHARKRSNYIYLNFSFDNLTAKVQTYLGPDAAEYQEIDVDSFKNSNMQDLSSSLYYEQNIEGKLVNSYLYADHTVDIASESFSLNTCLFDVAGNCTLTAQQICFEDSTYMWPVGKLVFKSPNENCPIKKIKIVAANSTQPIKVIGDVDFQNLKVNLEFLNISRLFVKLREQN